MFIKSKIKLYYYEKVLGGGYWNHGISTSWLW